MRHLGFLAMLAMGLVPGTAWANVMTLDWVSGGNNPVGYFYVSPYTAEIKGTNQPITLYCIDFNHEVAPPLEWQANIQIFDQANLPNMQYGGLPSPNTTWTNYEAAAWLINQLVQTTNLQQEAVYQYAAWEIFLDPAHTAIYNASVGAAGGSSFQSAIDTAYNNAFTAVNDGYTPTGLDIVTPNPAGQPDSTQEFLTFDSNVTIFAQSPEPSSIILLATVLAGCWLYLRRRSRAQWERI
jgi:hypothetical protein